MATKNHAPLSNNKSEVVKSGKRFKIIKSRGLIVEINPDNMISETRSNWWYWAGKFWKSKRQTRTYRVYKDGDNFTTVHHSKMRVFINIGGGCKFRQHTDGTLELFYPHYGSIFSEPNTLYLKFKSDSLEKLQGLLSLHRYANFRKTDVKNIKVIDGVTYLEYPKNDFKKNDDQYPLIKELLGL